MDLEMKTKKELTEGKCYPLGASLQPEGVNFALYSQNATEVYLLLFAEPHGEPTDIIRLENKTRNIFHVFVKGIKPGQFYGYKVKGEYNPTRGLRFNEHKLLLDPYAKAISHKAENSENLLLAYNAHSHAKDLEPDNRDNTSIAPKALVISDQFDWQGVPAPDIPLNELIIYEAHVKGFTAHPSSCVKQPGTYLGLIEKIPYLKSLGINALELLPVHECFHDDFLLKRGLKNYWGYNTLGFFAPELAYSTSTYPGCQVNEFKTLVRELHRAGIEVILDVVYNHSAEGSELGPTLSFRGIDNPTYYILTGTTLEPWRYYMNYTGCGNCLNLANSATNRLVMDSLRYWAGSMQVDGFRFDLASVLGREEGGFQKCASFFDTITQDPILCTKKLIAEPWDIGTYQVGNFPIEWSEWNGRFRDTVRKYIKGDSGQLRELGYRLTGSRDLYGDDGRSAYNSINFITCHDGFTLNDIFSYNDKHNEANGENNMDGSNDNNSWNCGAEGGTDNTEVLNFRQRLIKNSFCALFFSMGTPMLLGGDEFLRTQQGNNNAYCQDNELSWFDWSLLKKNAAIFRFVQQAILFRRKNPSLRRCSYLTGIDNDRNEIADCTWFDTTLNAPDWYNPEARVFCYQFDARDGISGADEHKDYLLFFIYNADYKEKGVALPRHAGKRWFRVVDTSLESPADFLEEGSEICLVPQDNYLTPGRTTVVLVGKA